MQCVTAVALAGFCFVLVACSEKTCVNAICFDQLKIDITTGSGQKFPTSGYAIDVTAETKSFQVQCDVGSTGGTCTPLAGSDASADVLSAELSADGKVISLTVMDRSERAQVVISRDGTPVASQEIRPTYTVTPADACRSECRAGTAMLSVDAL